MFNNNNNRGRDIAPTMPAPPPVQGSNGKRGMFSVLGPDVVVTGNIAATADLHIDGRVEGDVVCGTLAQGTESRIAGSVTADVARLAGQIEGMVRVRQLTVERSAIITGDVEYENITIENGGNIDGRLKHMSKVAAAPVAPAPVAATQPEATVHRMTAVNTAVNEG